MAPSKATAQTHERPRERLNLFPDAPRWCSRCSRHLPAAAFGSHNKTKDGLHTYCRECEAARQRRRYRDHPADYAARNLRRYMLTLEQFEAMVEAQNNLCAICKRNMGAGHSRHIDHCHKTGRIRGLLCRHCNTALGHADDSPERLRAMADYIERYRVE